MARTEAPELDPKLSPVAFLIGRWAGEGEGQYPTTHSFRYGEEITFSHLGKPFLAYTQRSWDQDDGRPLHNEMGYMRCASPNQVELLVAHPTGHVEVSEGTVEHRSLRLVSSYVGASKSAKQVTRLVRSLEVVGDELRYELEMEAVGSELAPHLRAVLWRVAGP